MVRVARPVLSKYVVEGAKVSSPSYGTVGPAVVREFVTREGPLGDEPHVDTSLHNPIDGRAHWDPNATLRIEDLEVSEGVDERAIKRSLRANAGKFEACSEQHGGRGKRGVRYRVFFDASGWVYRFDALDSELELETMECMDSVLWSMSWDGLPSVVESSITVELYLVPPFGRSR